MEKIQKILNKGLEKYEREHKIIKYKKKVIHKIKDCKTGAIGAHKYVCDECEYEEIAYNLCSIYNTARTLWNSNTKSRKNIQNII